MVSSNMLGCYAALCFHKTPTNEQPHTPQKNKDKTRKPAAAQTSWKKL